jgi:hypothetical protein
MTQPTIIFFGHDLPSAHDDLPLPKVTLRTLLFSTSKRGRIIESMHITLSRNESHQNFNIWGYGNERLVRGSGLFVGETGVEAYHHFLTPRDGTSFNFIEGCYRIDVFANLLGDRKKTRLFSQELEVSRELAASLRRLNTGVIFDWGPDSSRYLSHIDERPTSPKPDGFLEELLRTKQLSE